MPISFVCASCKKKLKVSDGSAGKRIRCPSCKEAVKVPEPGEFVSPDDDEAISTSPKSKKPAPTKKLKAPEGDYGLEEDDYEAEQERRRRREKKDRKNRDRDDRRRERRSLEPHRGGAVLMYGILSVAVFCVFLGSWYFAWKTIEMANEDLARMESRRMDPSGRGLTLMGKLLAIFGAVLATLTFILAVTLKVLDKL